MADRMLLKDADIVLFEEVVRALKKIFDPEIPVNIYDLGLIYTLEVDAEKMVYVTMTLTSPNCPVAEILPANVYHAVLAVEGVDAVDIQLVFDPPWTRDMISKPALLALGLM